MSAARANVQEFSAKVSKSVAAVGVASALLASVRLVARPDTRYRDGVTMATVRARANDDDAIAGGDDAWW